MVQEGIAAGHSPRFKLECLRLSCMERDLLSGFEEYVSYRSALEDHVRLPREQQDAVLTPEEPDAEWLGPREALYDLAISAGSLPNLRLLILDIRPWPYEMSALSIDNLSRGNSLEDLTGKFPVEATGRKGYASSSVSASFSQAARGGS
ncbi:54S ribosomal protein L4 [Pseudozyma hubeiensis]|nr:54S ribosomal protein L4 [Pseudozyma hubeiensis]